MPESLLLRTARRVADLGWEDLLPAVRERLPLVVLDVLGCGWVGARLGVHAAWVEQIVAAGGPADATVWARGDRLPAPHAALVNGTIAHHVEMDDGNSRASLHGGVTIVPAALALGEQTGASGRAVLAAIAAGYEAAIALGRPLLPGIGAHRLHPPVMVGCFGATAAASRMLGLNVEQTAGALALAAEVLPAGPFEAFTKGAPIKDTYGGWPALVGVQSALLAQAGLAGAVDLFEAPGDGLGPSLLHAPLDTAGFGPDPEEILHNQYKAYSTCRSVQPTLTAVERLGPLDPDDVAAIQVETYPYAVGLSDDADPTTAIGARTSIPYGVASLLLDGEVYPESFVARALADPRRQALAGRVRASIASDMASSPPVRGARITVTLTDGTIRRSEVRATRWSGEDPATPEELRAKFRRLAGAAAPALETAVDALPGAPHLDGLVAALRVRP
ncbi:MAG: MmgE/PrpD family protein [Chloroflexi bacterium]|nr:MmgE/PrpD family protein [Chloroflexota bacterium]